MRTKNSKKGFTLVEIIVVLVILAILAAIMIPSMTGWINKAQDKSAIVEARTMLLAAQTIASEDYVTTKSATALTVAQEGRAETLAGVGATFTTGSCTLANGQVTAMTITSSDGVTVSYAAGAFTVTEK